MSPTHSSATRMNRVHAWGALWLLVMIIVLASCADSGRAVEEQQPAPASQVNLDADQSPKCEPRETKHGNRASDRARHRQDRSERREHNRAARHANRGEADENENERDENEPDENEPDENEADES